MQIKCERRRKKALKNHFCIVDQLPLLFSHRQIVYNLYVCVPLCVCVCLVVLYPVTGVVKWGMFVCSHCEFDLQIQVQVSQQRAFANAGIHNRFTVTAVVESVFEGI